MNEPHTSFEETYGMCTTEMSDGFAILDKLEENAFNITKINNIIVFIHIISVCSSNNSMFVL